MLKLAVVFGNTTKIHKTTTTTTTTTRIPVQIGPNV